jgi:hypothetical protein
MRLTLAGVVGLAVTAAGAVVLGDYPLSGAVPWAAAVVIPFLIAISMQLVAGRGRTAIWLAAGPLGAFALAWGFWVAAGYGLDTLPASCWASGAVALLWPPAWGLLRTRRRPPLRAAGVAPDASGRD